ncbi:MAG: phosphatidylglycerol lysyltransferase domain-containing protein [Streptococcaceae bacterium]|nr:phosphatidylglycerol lysyltransferase domain-containing protein [Streptococcaceae bacterium]
MSKSKEKSKKNQKANVKFAKIYNRTPIWLANVLLLAAIWSLIVSVVGWFSPPIESVISTGLALIGLPNEISLFNAIVLFILSSAIRHRRRVALWIEMIYFQLAYVLIAGLSLMSYITGLISKHDLNSMGITLSDLIWVSLGVLFSLLLIIYLILSRRAFTARLELKTFGRSALIVSGAFITSIVVGFVISFTLYRHSDSILTHIIRVARESLSDFKYLVPFGQYLFDFNTGAGFWVYVTIEIIMVIGFFLAFLYFVRANQPNFLSTSEDKIKLRELLMKEERKDSLDYFATRRDKLVIFSSNGKAAIAYNLFGSVLLASGDPIGEKKAWKDAGQRFLELARLNGWTPAIVAVSSDGLEFYKKLGLSHATFGDEAVVKVKGFSLENSGLHEVAKVVRKVERENYHVSIRRQSEIPEEELKQLTTYTEEWRNDGPERGFSMATSRFGDATDRQMIIVTAFDNEDQAQGILSFVPAGETAISLDTMRRNPDSANGVTTFMIAQLIEECKNLGIAEVSLNFAVLRSVFAKGEQAQANSFERSARRILLFFSRWYQLESLYQSNDIYLPEWRPRYLAYDRGASTIEILIAIGRAEGFVTLDLVSRVKDFFIRTTSPEQKKWWLDKSFIDKVHADEDKYSQEKAGEWLSDYPKERIEKLEELKELNIPPHPTEKIESTPLENIINHYQYQEEIEDEQNYILVGRVDSIRGKGALCFADLRQGQDKIQLMLKRDLINDEAKERQRPEDFPAWKKLVNQGDMISVEGSIMRTQTGELSVRVKSWQIISKAIKTTEETVADYKKMKRYAQVLASVRQSFSEKGYLEVDGYAPLLSALVEGFDKGFEIEKQIHEGKTTLLVKSFSVFTDYIVQMDLMKNFISKMSRTIYENKFDTENWLTQTFYEAMSKLSKVQIDGQTSLEELRDIYNDMKLPFSLNAKKGQLLRDLYLYLIKQEKEDSIFYTQFPLLLAPTAKSLDSEFAENWELTISGRVVATGSTALTNPIELQTRASGVITSDKEELISAIEQGVLPYGRLMIDLTALMKSFDEILADSEELREKMDE